MKFLEKLKNQFAAVLSRDEMKRVHGGGDMGSLKKEYCDNMPCPSVPPEDWESNPQACSVFNSQRRGNCGYYYGIWGCVTNRSCLQFNSDEYFHGTTGSMEINKNKI